MGKRKVLHFSFLVIFCTVLRLSCYTGCAMYKDERRPYCRTCGEVSYARGFCASHYRKARKTGAISVSHPDPLRRRMYKLLANINARCFDPTARGFERYGGKGIRNFLTLEDLIFLWRRDAADSLNRPSIDRKQSNEDYTLVNCRFIELSENIARSTQERRPCKKCGGSRTGIKLGRAGICATCLTSCKVCGKAMGQSKKHICAECRLISRPCAYCGKEIVRDRVTASTTMRNKLWFCSKREQGLWLAAKTVPMRHRRPAGQ